MDRAKINQIMRKAMIEYKTRKDNYDTYLESQIINLKTLASQPNFNPSSFSNSQQNFSQINSTNQSPNQPTNPSTMSNSNESENYLKEIAEGIKEIKSNNMLSNNPSNNSDNPSQPTSEQNFNQPSNMAQPQYQPNIQTSGFAPNVPINIVAKNYINPESFDDDDEISEKKEDKSKKASLAKIPDNLLKEAATNWEPINYHGVDENYTLYGLATVEIKYDEESQKIIYKIIEPELTDEEIEKLEYLKNAFIYVFDKISPEKIKVSGKELIVDRTRKLASKYRIKFTEDEFEKITYYLVRDFLGLDILEPVMHDKFIEDISCDGLNVPIFVNHLKYGPLEVNRKYEDNNKLNSFIVKLAQKSNQEVSLSKPILQGALPDGSRVEAIYGKEISEKGSSYTIRKFREEPFTPIHLIEFGTIPPFLFAFLWLAVENKQSILVSGGTATGKTTALNALSLFVPPTSKIVSIEDTPEINLPHEHWLTLVSRESDNKSQVSMFDLLKAALRERPDYIIVGEIRGAEAAILFQGMATGHAGMGTVHAEKFDDLVNRMMIDPINLPPQLITELDIAIFIKQMTVKGNVVRRVTSVVEIIEYNKHKDKFVTNEFVKFQPADDEYEFTENSAIISKLLELRGGKEDSLWTEIEKRRRILDFMHKNHIVEFADVSNIMKAYHKSPANIFEYMDDYKENMSPPGPDF